MYRFRFFMTLISRYISILLEIDIPNYISNNKIKVRFLFQDGTECLQIKLCKVE